MSIDTNDIYNGLINLSSEFYPFLEGGDFDDDLQIASVRSFIEDPRAAEIMNDIDKQYPNIDNLEKQMYQGLHNYRNIFYDDEKLPEVYTFLSYLDYDNRIVFRDSFLLIALDMYLGVGYKAYADVAIPQYMSKRLTPDFIASDAMRAVAYAEMANSQKSKVQSPKSKIWNQEGLNDASLNTLIGNMILQGKIVYFLSKVLPSTNICYHLGYSKEEYRWCEENAKNIWAYFIQENLLFTEDHFMIRKIIDDGPSVNIFPGSPGRIGWYFGYKIVEQYMKNSDTDLPYLMSATDSREIFRVSGYRP
jgi:hypothetical protein